MVASGGWGVQVVDKECIKKKQKKQGNPLREYFGKSEGVGRGEGEEGCPGASKLRGEGGRKKKIREREFRRVNAGKVRAGSS